MARRALSVTESAVLVQTARLQPATVREVAAALSARRAWSRSTVATLLERLRGRGLLQRQRIDGHWCYSLVDPPVEVCDRLVADYLDGVLAGWPRPVLAWLARAELGPEDLARLRALVEERAAR